MMAKILQTWVKYLRPMLPCVSKHISQHLHCKLASWPFTFAFLCIVTCRFEIGALLLEIGAYVLSIVSRRFYYIGVKAVKAVFLYILVWRFRTSFEHGTSNSGP